MPPRHLFSIPIVTVDPLTAVNIDCQTALRPTPGNQGTRDSGIPPLLHAQVRVDTPAVTAEKGKTRLIEM